MGARQKEWARQARIRLTLALGGVCQVCAGKDSLTFDCREPMGGSHHAWDSSSRMSFYRAQARTGNITLLCHFCNSCKAGMSPDEYMSAVQHVRTSERIHRASYSPGEGTALTPADRRECFRFVCSTIRAFRDGPEQIKSA